MIVCRVRWLVGCWVYVGLIAQCLRGTLPIVNTNDLLVEKVKQLPEAQAEAVLAYVRELTESRHLTATDLMRLPPAERKRILVKQARHAETLYRQHPEMIVEDAEPPLNYG